MRSNLLFLVIAILTLTSLGHAQLVAEPAPLFAEKGKLLLSDDFAAGALAPEWKAAKGKWEIAGGALKGVEKAEDQHAAVIRRELKCKDFIAQFSFRFDGGKALSLSINDSKGHVCRARIAPTLIGVAKDKASKNSTDKPATLDTQKVELKPGQWHTMVVEVCGKQMIASLDGKLVVFGAHDGIDVPKTNIGFPVSGDSISLKDLRVFEALPPKDPAAAQKKLETMRQK